MPYYYFSYNINDTPALVKRLNVFASHLVSGGADALSPPVSTPETRMKNATGKVQEDV